ncbi:NUDIX hydrolase [Euzebya tangerina]|uniref:NUDIX hydrolase n=1 Tax=Euzebya tangerina TaxID=591198 RepID=UPI000E31E345|nr:CoA pyrophosphatase [Euzebya tangerina]
MSPTNAEVVSAVGAHRPRLLPDPGGRAAAATALILADVVSGPEILFIERAARSGDRWSGQMALPGGRRDPGDADLAATAVRETAEETGLVLPRPPIGRLDDAGSGGMRKGTVSTFVHTVAGRPDTIPEEREVAACVWIPLAHLLDPANAVRYRYGAIGPFAGIEHDGRTIWGLTHGILTGFAAILGRDLPRPRGFLLG